jgi:hypothetical protein
MADRLNLEDFGDVLRMTSGPPSLCHQFVYQSMVVLSESNPRDTTYAKALGQVTMGLTSGFSGIIALCLFVRMR